ncbi:hypothetical protein HBI07_240580 [Parastagonospora nodorum]|nr:hypothetical protein HBI07_240580 [Parastagonospora nodorum]
MADEDISEEFSSVFTIVFIEKCRIPLQTLETHLHMHRIGTLAECPRPHSRRNPR